MAEIYYIDGYNLLHFSPRWKESAEADLETGRDALVNAVSAWSAATGSQAKIIFDGTGRRTETSGQDVHGADVEVLYSSRRTSADALIERGVYGVSKRDSVIVVSADRGILDLCRGMGALTMNPAAFLRTLDEVSDRISSRLELHRSRGGLGALEDHLDESESDHLKDLRNKLEK